MTINITCTSSHIWKNIYRKFNYEGYIPRFHNKPYWERADNGTDHTYELTKTIRVSYDGLCIGDDYSRLTLGLSHRGSGWQGIPITVSEGDTYTKLINDIAKYVLHLTDNYLN